MEVFDIENEHPISITHELSNLDKNSTNGTRSAPAVSEEEMQYMDEKVKIIILISVFSYLIFGALVNFICRKYVCNKVKSNDEMEPKREIKHRDIILEQ